MHELSGVMWWLALGISVISGWYILAPLFKATGADSAAESSLGPKPSRAQNYADKKAELVAQYIAAQAAAPSPDDPQWQQRRAELEASYHELYQAYQQQR